MSCWWHLLGEFVLNNPGRSLRDDKPGTWFLGPEAFFLEPCTFSLWPIGLFAFISKIILTCQFY